ncbi:MAG: GNAT family N-acetyltransferase [Desulfurococcales archaeon]|nr:GNAT family N-acetyltransferase [Desulfurococcales archaeon]
MQVNCTRMVIRHDKVGEIIIRKPSPYDKKLVEEFLRRLSQESIYHRFFKLIKDYREIVDKMLGEDTKVCLLMEKDSKVIGCAEVYKTIWPEVGEPAVAILDDYQGKGLGKLLVFLLAICSYKVGIRRFRAYIFKENLPAIRIASKLSSKIIEDYGDSLLIEMEVERSLDDIMDYIRLHFEILPGERA